MTISSIAITLSTLLLAAESPTADTDGMTHAEHARIGDTAAEAVEANLAATYPDAEIEVTWSADAMMRHHVKVATENGPCVVGDREVTDVRDAVLAALEEHRAD